MIRRSRILLTLLTLVLTLAAKGDHRDVIEFLRECVDSRPNLTLQDVYKMLHQAEFGPGHMVGSLDEARNYLKAEAASLDMSAFPDEPLIESVSPRSDYVRINLRPYLRSGGDLDRLAKSFFDTAQTAPPGSSQDFHQAMREVMAARQEGQLALAQNDDSVVLTALASQDTVPPALSHSGLYKRSYQPSYRLIGRKLALTLR